MKRFVLLILTILQMLFIFSMSSQSGIESGELSDKVCKVICYVVIDGYGTLSQADQAAYIDKISFFVRKGAHMTEYAVLGILLMETVYSFRFDKRRKRKGKRKKGFSRQTFLSLLIGFAYACSDEYHQTYVASRSGQLSDVLVDTSGLLIGILIALIVQKIRVYRIWNSPDYDPADYFEHAYDYYSGPPKKYKEYGGTP